MRMLLKISWRNVWRSRIRSLVVIGAITVGVWALIFMLSFSYGMIRSYINNAIENEISHIQIHHPEFPDEREVTWVIPEAEALLEEVQQEEAVQAAALRSSCNAMLSSSRGTRGIQLRGIDPADEAALTKLDQKLVEGEYLEADGKNQILISQRLADKLQAKLRTRLVLTFQGLDGEITAAAFRVVGLFDTGNRMTDESNAFVLRSDLNRLLGSEAGAHELALFLQSPDQARPMATVLQERHPELLVRSYAEVSPEIELFNSQIQASAMVFVFIVMLALVFGIINTMLMAVLERTRELGVLMAIGMNKGRVFAMIVLETLLIGLLAGPLGILLGYLTIRYFGERGIDLSAYSEGMQEFGMEEIVYLSIDSSMYVQIAVAVVVTAILGAIYPAWKAMRLHPVDAIRTH